jgi:hypothetical protein
MTSDKSKLSPQTLSRQAGILYLLMGFVGALSIVYIPSILIVYGDAATTAKNILDSEGLFRVGILGRLLTQVIQIFLVLALYKLLKPVNKNQAVLMLILILVAVPIAILAELNQFAALILLNNTNYGSFFSSEQIEALASLFINLNQHGIVLAHIFWGLWLFPMGYLVFKSRFIPKLIGILLMIGCFGYLIDFSLFILAPHIEMTISQYTFIGELVLPLWLLIKGVNVEEWEKQLLESAYDLHTQ